MRQTIIDFGTPFGMGLSLRIYGYGLMMVLGFLTAISIARWRARRMGESPDVMTQVGILSLIGGVLGARLAYVIQHWDTQFAHAHSLGDILNITSGGLIYYGGLVLASLVVLVFLLAKRLPIRRHLDIVTVSLMVGLAFGRAGCLLNGCCYGGPCGKDWALGTEFPMYSEPLVKLDGRDNPFSLGQEGPSPIFHNQLQQRAERIHAAKGADEPAALDNHAEDILEKVVTVPEELVHFAAVDRVPVDDPAAGDSIKMLRVLPPRDLHHKLTTDQVSALFRSKEETRKAFDALAGSDRQLAEAEWRGSLAEPKEGGLLAGSEHWSEAISFDGRHDGKRDGELSFDEFWTYAGRRKEFLINRYGRGDDEKARADINARLQSDEIALATAAHALPIKPAQALGIINALLLAVILSLFHRLRKREGQVFALLLVLYPITRFMLEAIRDDNPHNLMEGVLTHNQYTSLAMVLGGIVLFVLLRKMPASCGPTWAQRLARAQTSAGKRGGTSK